MSQRSFVIKNKYLSGLVQWLQLQELDGIKNRETIRFISKVQERLKEVDKIYASLLAKHIKKDIEGKFVTTIKAGLKFYTAEDKENEEQFVKEINDLFEEEFTIKDNEEMLEVIKGIVVNSDYRLTLNEEQTDYEKMRSMRLATEYPMYVKSFNN